MAAAIPLHSSVICVKVFYCPGRIDDIIIAGCVGMKFLLEPPHHRLLVFSRKDGFYGHQHRFLSFKVGEDDENPRRIFPNIQGLTYLIVDRFLCAVDLIGIVAQRFVVLLGQIPGLDPFLLRHAPSGPRELKALQFFIPGGGIRNRRQQMRLLTACKKKRQRQQYCRF